MTYSPMMQQYFKIKEDHKDALLFFRLGDFYEMFFEDALTASRELELTLTARDSGGGNRAPMCGVPFHSVDSYIARLINKGYKVAICEQGEVIPGGKALVERNVVRTITKGTADVEMLDESRNNYILSAYMSEGAIGAAYSDITTGDFFMSEFSGENALTEFENAMVRIAPAECLCNLPFIKISQGLPLIASGQLTSFSAYLKGDYSFEKNAELLGSQFEGGDPKTLSVSKNATVAAGVLLQYLKETQKRELPQINKLSAEQNIKYMGLDYNTRRNLELTETIRDKGRKGSLIGLLDKTLTSMGARAFRLWVERPLCDLAEIRKRQDGVEELLNNVLIRAELAASLKGMKDIERLVSKLAYGSFNPPNCIALKETLRAIPPIKAALSRLCSGVLKEVNSGLNPLEKVANLLDAAIDPEQNATLARDGGFIRKGYSEELDYQTELRRSGTSLIRELEALERQETGIKNLKIGYNNVFGYYIEVSKGQAGLVPFRYTRRQTLANCERYITEDLKVLEEKILSAQDEALKIELQIYSEICEVLKQNIEAIQANAHALKILDCLIALASAAYEYNYVKPEIRENGALDIKRGRHPVVENVLEKGSFTPNDSYIDGENDKILIITGPNMAGKSTYMRQVALITLMAHIGSYVPAESAVIPLTDNIFTRIGASDDLAAGQSTFMVEMSELAYILNNCTPQSLIVLDEIGRGTSTFDGLSIAWSVIEYLSESYDTKTLFSTHYHELTELEGKLGGVKNYCVTVEEVGNTIKFLHKIMRGGALKSFGIEVASLAGLPEKVIGRAKDIMKKLEAADINVKH